MMKKSKPCRERWLNCKMAANLKISDELSEMLAPRLRLRYYTQQEWQKISRFC
jgi:hypothetical protein